MPTDPRDLMLLAAQSNDLTSEDVKPWHVRATYKLFDEQGTVTDEGTYEESWVGPNKFKRMFAGKEYKQTDYGMADGVRRSGQREDVSRLLISMRRDLITPLPNALSLSNGPFTEKHIDSAGTNLRCITLVNPAGTPVYCIAADQAMLRISFWPGDEIQIIHNRILRFQSHYVAGDLIIVRTGNTVLSAHLDSIEVLTPVNDGDFAGTSDAVLLPRRVNISAGVAAGLLEYKVNPKYPAEAKAQRIQGTIVLQALIGVDGHIKDLLVVSGPQILQKPALDAVRTWHYRPYLLNGSPVEVMTSINVIFSFGE